MIYLHVIAEGQTEKRFVDHLLAPYLGYDYCVDTSLVMTSKDLSWGRRYKGGLGNYQKVKKDIVRRLKQHHGAGHCFTTMFDLYALPMDFPGFSESQMIIDSYQRVKQFENALADDVGDNRLIPYIQLHEFEAMIFVEPGQLVFEYPDMESKIEKLNRVLDEKNIKNNPELIDEGEETAPSKRILKIIADYNKPIAGVNTVERIGINAIRSKCPHFDEWLKKLEQLKPNLHQQ